MLTRLKQYALIGLVIAAFYYLLSHHFIFYTLSSFDTLAKEQLTLRYTFYSLKTNSPEAAMRVDVLREAGIGELMVDQGLISEENRQQILNRIEAKRYK